MNNLFPENSYMGKCSCGKEFIAPKGAIHCHNCLYQKISELENTRTQSQWISVDDRLPESGAVLISHLSSFNSPVVSVAFTQGKSFYSGTSYPVQRVTHWMPLPEPPKAGE